MNAEDGSTDSGEEVRFPVRVAVKAHREVRERVWLRGVLVFELWMQRERERERTEDRDRGVIKVAFLLTGKRREKWTRLAGGGYLMILRTRGSMHEVDGLSYVALTRSPFHC